MGIELILGIINFMVMGTTIELIFYDYHMGTARLNLALVWLK